MNPTRTTTGVDPTPAETLRDAALYLQRHGWHQGDMYDDPQQPTPAACTIGAVKMAVCGGPTIDHTPDTGAQVDAAVAVLTDHLTTYGYVDPDNYIDPYDVDEVVADWNDLAGRTATQVTAVLLAAADEWDRLHHTSTPIPGDPITPILVLIDEIAYYSAARGEKTSTVDFHGVVRNVDGTIQRGPSLSCGCPLDADCCGHHGGDR